MGRPRALFDRLSKQRRGRVEVEVSMTHPLTEEPPERRAFGTGGRRRNIPSAWESLRPSL